MRDEIQILSEVEAIRQNPWMYIGSVGEDGAHHLLYEVVHNAVDEATLGHCKSIQIQLNIDECSVSDDGRGIPTETHSQAGIPSCEVALTRLHSGSKFTRTESKYTAGLHGVGLSCVNALSSDLALSIDRGGHHYTQNYQRGKPLETLRDNGTTNRRGTKISFKPDHAIFKTFKSFDAARCRTFLEDLALINPGLELQLSIEKNAKYERFYSDHSGLFPLLEKYAVGRRRLFPEPLAVELKSGEMHFRALFTWTAESDSTVISFVNSVRTIHGGTHVGALRSGLVKALNKYLLEQGRSEWQKNAATAEEICEGLLCALTCQVLHPNFEGQTKSRFTNIEVVAKIEQAVSEQCYTFLKAHEQIGRILAERISDSRNARLAAKRVSDRVYLQHARKGINEEVYKEQFGARSKNWHDSAVWITHNELLKSHGDLCKVSPDSVALDVCCGSGVVGASFKGKVKKIIGLDLTPEMVNLAKQRLDEVVQGNVYNIPFPDNSFDLVCTREVLHLLPYPERPVSEIFRVLKPGGQFVVGQILPFSEDDSAWMYRVFKKKQPLIYNMFQEEDFKKLLLSPGFTDMEMNEMNVWESIDVWIDSYETTSIHRHEIRELFRTAPEEAKAVHPFTIDAGGKIQDLWRWCIFSLRKPG